MAAKPPSMRLRSRQCARKLCRVAAACVVAGVALAGRDEAFNAIGSFLRPPCASTSSSALRSRTGMRELPCRIAVARSALPDAGAILDVGSLLQALPDQVAAMGSWGIVYYQALFILIQQLVVFPIIPLIMTSAYVFDGPLMYVMAALGIMGSQAVGFMLARFALQPQIEKMWGQNQTFKKISTAVKKDGFKIVMLGRLSLVISTPLQNFIFGALTTVSFIDFFAATILASVPEGLIIVYLTDSTRGALGTMGGEEGLPWYFIVVAVLAVLALVNTIADIAKKALDESLEEGDEQAIHHGVAHGGA